jgi:hypothetical protein
MRAVLGQDLRQGERLAGVDLGTAYAARAQQRAVAAAAARSSGRPAIFRSFQSFTGNAVRE